MLRSNLGLIVAFAAGAVAAGGVALWLSSGSERGDEERSGRVGSSEARAPAIPEPSEDEPFAIPPDQLAALMEKLREVDGAEAEEDANDEAPAPPPTQVHYVVPEKYGEQKLSEVPHQLLGAWDDAPDTETPGRHRSFVLVVDPDLSDRELEFLARDIYHQQHDADRLDVRIYDRENAATDARVSDDGRYAHKHQVAQVTRHRGLNVDVIRVRGRVVAP